MSPTKAQAVFRKIEENYKLIKSLIEEDKNLKNLGKDPELFFDPFLAEFIIEKFYQDNLKILFVWVFSHSLYAFKVKEKQPKYKIDQLTSISDEDKEKIFENYFDRVASDYITAPVCLKGTYFDVLTCVKLLVKASNIPINLEGNTQSLLEHATSPSPGNNWYYFTPNREDSLKNAGDLLQMTLMVIIEINRTPERWAEFVKHLMSLGISRVELELLIGRELNSIEEFIQSRKEEQAYSQCPVGLLAKMICDLKQIGCKFKHPYNRDLLTITDVTPIPNTYLPELDKRIALCRATPETAVSRILMKEKYRQKFTERMTLAKKVENLSSNLCKFHKEVARVLHNMTLICEPSDTTQKLISTLPGILANFLVLS
jgi:hypothetical protein